MSDYDYKNNPTAPEGYQPTIEKENAAGAKKDLPKISKTQGGRDYDVKGHPLNAKILDINKQFSRANSPLPSTPAPLKGHEVKKTASNSDFSSENDSLPLVSSIAKAALPEADSKNGKIESHSNGVVKLSHTDGIPLVVKNFLDPEAGETVNLSTEIKDMSLNQLKEALENIDKYTDDQIDEIIDRLDDLSVEQDDILEDGPSISELNTMNEELEHLDKEISNTVTIIVQQSNKHAELGEIDETEGVEVNEEIRTLEEQVYVYVQTDAGLVREKLTYENRNEGIQVQFDEKTRTIKASSEDLKKIEGQPRWSRNDNGDLVPDNYKMKAFSQKEEQAFKSFIASNYQPTTTIIEDEIEENKPEEQVKSNDHVKSRDLHDASNDEKITNDRKLSKGNLPESIASAVNVSTTQLFFERLDKIEKEIKRVEDKIKNQIQTHANLTHADLVAEKARNEQSLELKKSYFISNEQRADILEIENQYKSMLKEVIEHKSFDIPLAVSNKFKSVEINLQKIEKLVVKNDLSDATKDSFTVEISTFKKQMTSIGAEMLNTSGVQVTKGTTPQQSPTV